MKAFASDVHRLHFPKGELSGGVFVRPYECPERWEHIHRALLRDGHVIAAPLDAPDPERLARVHAPDYLAFLATAWNDWQQAGFDGEALPSVFPARRMTVRRPEHIDGRLGYYAFALETAITAGTHAAALSSAACAEAAAAELSSGARTAFALCRPPGHHAGIDLYGGYCFLNNAAIAAQRLLDDGATRVAVLDVDFHHGNGTQDIFHARDDVLFVSLHGDPQHAFPHFMGYADETGHGVGEGFTLNLPLPVGCDYARWFDALEHGLDRIAAYAPDALVVSLGVDTFKDDPISFFALETDDFLHYGARLARAALPTLFVMEGGYAVAEIGDNVAAVLAGFEGAG